MIKYFLISVLLNLLYILLSNSQGNGVLVLMLPFSLVILMLTFFYTKEKGKGYFEIMGYGLIWIIVMIAILFLLFKLFPHIGDYELDLLKFKIYKP